MPPALDPSTAKEAGGAPVKIISWNIANKYEPWHWLLDSDADLALLQEAGEPPPEVVGCISVGPDPWCIPGADGKRRWRSAVVKLSDRVEVDWIEAQSLVETGWDGLAASRPGALAAAHVTPRQGDPFVAVSLYAVWEGPHSSTGNQYIFADASAHRLISDLSRFIGSDRKRGILAAGDLNILHGHGEHGSGYWAARYQTVFDRMEALGLTFAGPQAPDGRQADPWPAELPLESKNVPTFHHNKQTPATATRQLDFVFASQGMSDSVRVRALNDPEQWGPSDHCRLEIEVS